MTGSLADRRVMVTGGAAREAFRCVAQTSFEEGLSRTVAGSEANRKPAGATRP